MDGRDCRERSSGRGIQALRGCRRLEKPPATRTESGGQPPTAHANGKTSRKQGVPNTDPIHHRKSVSPSRALTEAKEIGCVSPDFSTRSSNETVAISAQRSKDGRGRYLRCEYPPAVAVLVSMGCRPTVSSITPKHEITSRPLDLCPSTSAPTSRLLSTDTCGL